VLDANTAIDFAVFYDAAHAGMGTTLTTPQRSVVLCALDGANQSRLAIQKVPARAGDRLLLCSDGVSDYIADDQIAGLLGLRDPRGGAQAPIDFALQQGAKDSITAIVADVVARVDPDDGWLDSLPAPAEGG
jgi:PPM family protein phosphatase